MEVIQEQLTALEDLLVREFRACQALQALTREERRALASGHVDDLKKLIDQKVDQLDEMSELEGQRRQLVGELNLSCGLQPDLATLADLLVALPAESAGRLSRLGEGILTLLVDVRDMTHGNRAIATTALERADAIQAYLLGLYQQGDPPLPGRDPGAGASSSAGEAFQRP